MAQVMEETVEGIAQGLRHSGCHYDLGDMEGKELSHLSMTKQITCAT